MQPLAYASHGGVSLDLLTSLEGVEPFSEPRFHVFVSERAQIGANWHSPFIIIA